MKTLTKTVLIAGAQGVIGRAAAEHFSKEADTTVYAVSRRPVVGLENVHPISADLLDPADTRTKLEALIDVTHVIFGAYVEKATPNERSSVNVALLRNLLDVVEESAPDLQHVCGKLKLTLKTLKTLSVTPCRSSLLPRHTRYEICTIRSRRQVETTTQTLGSVIGNQTSKWFVTRVITSIVFTAWF